MAKDDYFVIVYRVLVYLYACLKRRIVFDEATFSAAVRRDAVNEAYFADVLRLMQEEGLIKGLEIRRVWGGQYVLLSSERSAQITPDGILYLQENGTMARVGAQLRAAADLIVDLAALL